MSEEDRVGFPPPEYARRQGRNWLATCLVGCLVAGVVGLLVCAGGAWWTWVKFSPMGADRAREAIVSGIESSELSEEDKQAVVGQVDRVVDAFKSGEIGTRDVFRILEQLAESPLLGLVVVYAADAKYITPSELSDEEKEEGRLTLQRVARGVFEERIDPNALEDALDYISVRSSDGHRQFKDTVSDPVLRDFLAECKRHADDADIPREPYVVDIGMEFQRAVDQILGEQ